MGLSFLPRYVGPSPKKLLLIAAFGIAAAAGGYEFAQHQQANAPAQSTQRPAPPAPK